MRFKIDYSHHRLNHRARQACCDLFALGVGALICMYIVIPVIHQWVDAWADSVLP